MKNPNTNRATTCATNRSQSIIATSCTTNCATTPRATTIPKSHTTLRATTGELTPTLIKSQRGATVLIAIGIATLLIAFSFGIGALVKTTTQNLKAFKESSRAQLLAESGMETLLQLGAKKEAGFSMDQDDCKAWLEPMLEELVVEEGGDTTADILDVKCEVKGRSDSDSMVEVDEESWYSIPALNTGDAASDCNPLNPDEDGENSCNWGKLNFGSSYSSRVAIPLYIDISGPDEDSTIVNPKDFEQYHSEGLLPITDLKIRFRTPCEPVPVEVDYDTGSEKETKIVYTFPENCAKDERYEIGVKDGSSYGRITSPGHIDLDPTIINWEISGKCAGRSCSLGADKGYREENNLRESDNSEIFATLINQYSYDDAGAQKYTNEGWQLDDSELGDQPYSDWDGQTGSQPTILDFLTDYIVADRFDVKTPTLQLAIITNELKDVDGRSIPYLEYQVLSKSPLANSVQVYTIEVAFQGQSHKIIKGLDAEKKLVDFAVQN